MAMSEEALKRIVDVGQRLIDSARWLHLSGIAKSIEQEEGCQIFIAPFDNAGPNIKCTCCVATCESCIRPSLKESGIIQINHHVVFYRPHPEDIEAERLGVAHGLAHCVLHWPLGPRRDRLVKGNFNGVDMYLVRFLEEEEAEADALACLLTAYRPAL